MTVQGDRVLQWAFLLLYTVPCVRIAVNLESFHTPGKRSTVVVEILPSLAVAAAVVALQS